MIDTRGEGTRELNLRLAAPGKWNPFSGVELPADKLLLFVYLNSKSRKNVCGQNCIEYEAILALLIPY